MKSLDDIRAGVKELRKQGKSFGEIQQFINQKIAKSTLSGWCRGIELSTEDRRRLEKKNYLNLRRGREMAISKSRAKKNLLLKELIYRNKFISQKIDKDVARLLLAILYLGEGAKRDGLLVLGSSSIDIIKLYLKLLVMCYGISSDRIKCRISYRADQDINKLQSYWSSELKIPTANFYKTKPDPRTINKITKNKEYKGVCVIHILKSTAIQREMMIIAKTLNYWV